MKYELRDYQQRAVSHAADFFKTAKAGDRRCYAAPTGTGKSIIELALQRAIPGSWIVTPRVEIIAGMISKLGIEPPEREDVLMIVAKSLRMTTPIRLRNALLSGSMEAPVALIFDEGHHDLASTWQDIHTLCGYAPAVAFTATPFRGTPKGTARFRELWGDPVWIMTFREAQAAGHLTMPRCSMLPLVDDDIIEISNGELVVSAVNDATRSRLAELVEHCKRWWDGEHWDTPTMFACPSGEIAKDLCERLNAADMVSRTILQDTTHAQRQRIFHDTIKKKCALVQVYVVSEGVDLPIRRLVDLSPTMSPVKWAQQFGRITRPGGVSEYVCIGHDSPVLTDRGWVKIQDVTTTDMVWDGVEWVNHGGVVCNGHRDVITISGIDMTPDHMVLTYEGWIPAWHVLERIEPHALNTTIHASSKKSKTRSLDAATRRTAASSTMGGGESSFISPGAMTWGRSLSTSSPYQGGTIPLSPSTELIMMSGMNLEISGSQREAFRVETSVNAASLALGESTTQEGQRCSVWRNLESPIRTLPHGWIAVAMPSRKLCPPQGLCPPQRRSPVYDILNAGPRNRYQVGCVIVHNCTNRNLFRHAYILDGAVPHGSLLEAQKAFDRPATRNAARVIGLEALGKLKACDVPLANGLIATGYMVSAIQGDYVVDYCAIVHPNREDVYWAQRNSERNAGAERTWGRWQKCESPESLEGYNSVSPGPISEKQAAWWKRAANRHGLASDAEVNAKTFQVLPVLADTQGRL